MTDSSQLNILPKVVIKLGLVKGGDGGPVYLQIPCNSLDLTDPDGTQAVEVLKKHAVLMFEGKHDDVKNVNLTMNRVDLTYNDTDDDKLLILSNNHIITAIKEYGCKVGKVKILANVFSSNFIPTSVHVFQEPNVQHQNLHTSPMIPPHYSSPRMTGNGSQNKKTRTATSTVGLMMNDADEAVDDHCSDDDDDDDDYLSPLETKRHSGNYNYLSPLETKRHKGNKPYLSPLETRIHTGKNDSPACKPPNDVDCAAQHELIFSPLTTEAAKMEMLWCQFIRMHKHVANKTYDKEGKRTRRKCKMCQRKTMWQCKECGKYICPDDQGKDNKMCYRKHIIMKHPKVGLEL